MRGALAQHFFESGPSPAAHYSEEPEELSADLQHVHKRTKHRCTGTWFARCDAMLPLVEPVLPILSKVIPIGREWLYEPKLDGFRGTLYIEGKRGLFRSKTKKRMARFKDLAESLARTLEVESAVFDGEIIVMRDSRVDFNALLWADAEPAYAAFDLLWLNGTDLRSLPLHKRKRKLRAITRRGPIAYVEAMREPALYDAVVRLDLEGIVAKRKSDPYTAETEWLKIKHVGYSQKEGRAELFHRLRRR